MAVDLIDKKIKYSKGVLDWLELVLQERFGDEVHLYDESGFIELRIDGSNKRIKFLSFDPALYFPNSDLGCDFWDSSSEGFESPIDRFIPAPCSFSTVEEVFNLDAMGGTVNYDMLGLCYWSLNRIEEVDRQDLDEHQRFLAVSSHAYKYNYLDRPVVDEWFFILAQFIKSIWPSYSIKNHTFSINVSHDVDCPSLYAFKSWPRIMRVMLGHLIKRRSLRAVFTAFRVKLFTRKKLHTSDPFNTFDWLMDVSESNGIKSAFYFICGRTDVAHDSDYEPEHAIIRNLMKSIYDRGHEIGLHPSYNTFQSAELISKEAERLKKICSEEGIEQSIWGGRMHYLRWAHPTTLRYWSAAGMNYDSTLGYADRPGFRCGTCFEFPAFDLIEDKVLPLRVRPLIVMECSVIDETYLGLGLSTGAREQILTLKQRCKLVNGDFNLLWHNSYFLLDGAKSFYAGILSGKVSSC